MSEINIVRPGGAGNQGKPNSLFTQGERSRGREDDDQVSGCARGKRRLHQRPNGGEIQARKFWLDHEIVPVKPKLVVTLGATAAQSLRGKAATISKLRRAPIAMDAETTLFVTVHRS